MQTKNLSLLQAKIAALRTALFFCDNQHDLCYAAHVVEVERMDAAGCIWLSINNYGARSVAEGELFPVSLDFYRKGLPYTIDIKGMAAIETATKDKLILKITVGRLQYKTYAEDNNVPVKVIIGKLFRNVFDIPEPLDEFAPAD